MFHLKHKQSGTYFTIPKESLRLSMLIESLAYMLPEHGTKEKPIVVDETFANDVALLSYEEVIAKLEKRKPNLKGEFINSVREMQFVVNYLNIHANDTNNDYCGKRIVRTGNVEKIIKDKRDLKLITDYVTNIITRMPKIFLQQLRKHGHAYKTYYILLNLNVLIHTAERYYRMESLTNILYSYATAIMHDVGADKISDISGDGFFRMIGVVPQDNYVYKSVIVEKESMKKEEKKMISL